jgi:glycine oxidase
VAFLASTPSEPWQYQAGKTTLRFPEGVVETKNILLASGAWTGEFLKSLGLAAPLIPVKGQMFRIRKFYPEKCMVHFNEDIYLVPRGDSLIVGATTEPKTWNPGFDSIGSEYLTRHLMDFLPEVNREPLESWAGFRPRTRDRLPWMGWLDSERGWAICAGHYKCGISMAPLAAECMIDLIKGERTPIPLEPFNPWRRQGLNRVQA